MELFDRILRLFGQPDQELDDMTQRAAVAEVERDKAEAALTRCQLMIGQWAGQLESQAAVRGDMLARDVANLVAKMRAFIE